MTEPLDLDELERILQRATPGPWRSYSNGDVVGPEGTSLFIQRAYAAESGTETLPVFIQPADALLLEVARNDLPALLARLRAAEARLPVEVGKAAKLGLDVARDALEGQA